MVIEDITQMAGYYKRKNKFKVGNVNDFINKIRKAKVLEKYFENDSLDYGGIR